MKGKRLTREQFIGKSQKVHGNKYDYSKVEYINNRTKVCIICPIHGEFWQTPASHLDGSGCPKCKGNKLSMRQLSNVDEFIEKAKKLHGDRYDYSRVTYINGSTEVRIVCPIHGEFLQTPNSHLQGHGCPTCKIGGKKTTEEFIKNARKIHGNFYDYSKVEYKGYDNEICIICPIHGEFWQKPSSHLQGSGCQECGKIKKSSNLYLTTEEFIERARRIHDNKYDYSKVIYRGTYKKICIICPKHGEFWQTPRSHLSGHGCPNCQNSILENNISNLLKIEHIEYEEKKCFKWLGKQHLDFYLPKYNIGIECQGEQHFISKEHFGGDIGLNTRKKLDKKKYDLCCENGIKIIYYTDNLKRKKMFDENIIHNNNDLIKIINNGN